VDSTISLPLITAYALSKVAPRKLKRLYDSRDKIYDRLCQQYFKHGTVEKTAHRTDVSSTKTAKRPRRNLAKRSTGAGMQK